MPLVTDSVRKLATVETIASIHPIAGADAVEQVLVRGWSVVVKKGEFAHGDRVVFFEPDSALPLDDERFAFLAARGAKTVEGRDYHILKTAKLRGTYSQGLVLPLAAFWDDLSLFWDDVSSSPKLAGEGALPATGLDVTEALSIMKWEAPLPSGGGDISGPFLHDLTRKTDSERLQNLLEVWEVIRETEWDFTEKVDGTSCTVLRDGEGTLRVMGRNWEIAEGANIYWQVVKHERYAHLFEALAPGEVVQFEIAGPGVQGNGLQLSQVRPFIFDFARGGVMMPRSGWPEALLEWAVPQVDFVLPETALEAIALVDGMKSVVNPKVLAEGIVLHTSDGRVLPGVGGRNTLKIINNKWLSKHDAR